MRQTPMPVAPEFNRDFEPRYGEAVELSKLVRRVVANNASPFTFHGTGTYIAGRGEVAIIDPGPLDDAHVSSLLKAVKGERVSHILVTHNHLDHSPAAVALKARTGARIFGPGPMGREETDDGARVEEGIDANYRPDEVLRDGETIKGKGWTISCVFTPGHTSNHMCYALEEEQALFCGDHIMGWSTSVVIPPNGTMTDYLHSLTKIARRDDSVLYPTHGAPIGGKHDGKKRNPQNYVLALIAHREERERQIAACLEHGIGRIADMVAALYRDVDPMLHPAAARSVHAHLIRMAADRRASSDGPPTLEALYRSGAASGNL